MIEIVIERWTTRRTSTIERLLDSTEWLCDVVVVVSGRCGRRSYNESESTSSVVDAVWFANAESVKKSRRDVCRSACVDAMIDPTVCIDRRQSWNARLWTNMQRWMHVRHVRHESHGRMWLGSGWTRQRIFHLDCRRCWIDRVDFRLCWFRMYRLDFVRWWMKKIFVTKWNSYMIKFEC
jgi:hypothetical protein